MSTDAHFVALQNMYLAAPINTFYRPTIEVADSRATIEIEVSEKLFHAARAVHGSVYFKMLDDAAFFAANSVERDVFVLTASFTTYLTRPVSTGRLRSEGRLLNCSRSQLIAEAVVYDTREREVGRGSGLFVRSKILLSEVPGYAPARSEGGGG
jgi:uncharacterized protein (TIGR00369 family)